MEFERGDQRVGKPEGCFMQHHFLTLAILHSHLEDLLESIGIHVEFN